MAKFKSASPTKAGEEMGFQSVNEFSKYLTHINERRDSFYHMVQEELRDEDHHVENPGNPTYCNLI